MSAIEKPMSKTAIHDTINKFKEGIDSMQEGWIYRKLLVPSDHELKAKKLAESERYT